MKVKVCDALCGAGKTVSCINMMNSDTEHKYIFVTPYLNEVDRIKNACTDRGFVTPEKTYDSHFSKIRDLPKLLAAGKNIVSTHALFSCYTDEIKDLIKEQGYILVLDEVIDLFQPVDIDRGDIDFLKRNNIAREEGDNIIWEDDDYNGAAFSEVMRLSKSRDMVNYDGAFYFWALPIDVFKCFSDVYVLTYLFEYQLLKYFFEVNGIEYELIGTTKKNGTYQFCPISEMNRAQDLRSKIHINTSERFNEIGYDNFSLSSGWFERAERETGQPKLAVLQNNLYNIFRHKGVGVNDKMWTTLNKYRKYLKGKGYANNFLTFNRRASNEYVDKHHLAYCLNVYMMPWMKNYLVRLGIKEVNQDMYALSVLIQWIFRSGIRNGDEIWVYVPSSRMRYLLQTWLDNLAEGNDLKEIKFSMKNVNRLGVAAYQMKKAAKTKNKEANKK